VRLYKKTAAKLAIAGGCASRPAFRARHPDIMAIRKPGFFEAIMGLWRSSLEAAQCEIGANQTDRENPLFESICYKNVKKLCWVLLTAQR
jgi:hypothetical protein